MEDGDDPCNNDQNAYGPFQLFAHWYDPAWNKRWR